jgi:hypothetical protein
VLQLAWDRTAEGSRLVAGVCRKQPLLIIDVGVSKTMPHSRAESDVFAACFYSGSQGVLCGGRSGKAWAIDLRARSAPGLPPLTD